MSDFRHNIARTSQPIRARWVFWEVVLKKPGTKTHPGAKRDAEEMFPLRKIMCYLNINVCVCL